MQGGENEMDKDEGVLFGVLAEQFSQALSGGCKKEWGRASDPQQ